MGKGTLSYGKVLRQIGAVTTIPMVFAAGPLVGYVIGAWGDLRLGTDPWGKIIFVLLGFAASLRQVISIIRRWINEEKDP